MLTPAMRKMKEEMAKKGKKFASSRHLPATKAKGKAKVSRKKGNKTAKRKG